MSFHIYDRDTASLLSPGTAPIWFESQQDAEQHLRRLPREDVASGRYSVFEAPSRAVAPVDARY